MKPSGVFENPGLLLSRSIARRGRGRSVFPLVFRLLVQSEEAPVPAKPYSAYSAVNESCDAAQPVGNGLRSAGGLRSDLVEAEAAPSASLTPGAHSGAAGAEGGAMEPGHRQGL